jgi:methionyl-tRNA synthetase
MTNKVSHSYWTMDRVKMSKSIGNVVNPSEIILKYGLDPVRYFLLSQGGLSDDNDFSYSMLFVRLKVITII